MARRQEDQDPNDLQRHPSVTVRPRSRAARPQWRGSGSARGSFQGHGLNSAWPCRSGLALLLKLGLDRILHARPSRERSLRMATIVMHLLEPGSKLATARGLSAASTDTTLGSLLDLGEVSAEDLYAALDWWHRHQSHIE